MFRVGQKVVCIHHHPLERRHAWGKYPERNAIYTIRDISPYKGKHLLLFHEISNPIHECGIEYGFDSTRFRPLVERKTDISIFEEILRRESVPDECAPVAQYGVDWGASA